MLTVEQRRSKRVPVRMRVDCKPLSGSEVRDIMDGHGYEDLTFASLALSRPRQGMLPARIRDLSGTGLCMEGPLALGPGEVAALDLHLPDDRVAIKILVEVVWTKCAAQCHEPHACGMRFAAFEEDGNRRLRAFLATAESKHPEARVCVAH